MKHLVIVESPTKGRTIAKFLGSDYQVEASFGHVRDLPKSKMGIDIEHDFQPSYTIPLKAKETIKNLKAKAKAASSIILATDEDREGEAISWHLVQALGLEAKSEKRPTDAKALADKKAKNSGHSHANSGHSGRIQRIVFHEITKTAIEAALKNPREIDLNLVDAQQARRILDRLVGYELSPFLWRKIRYGLSAGRVQSVAVRLVVEREREIQKFVKEEYWSVEAELSKIHPLLNPPRKGEETKKTDSPPLDKGEYSFPPPLDKGGLGGVFRAKLSKIGNKPVGKMDIKTEADAKKIVSDLSQAAYSVADIQKKQVKRNPAPPFTTSTLQQEAARKLGFSAKQTMVIAQKLYELGHITYMRTDSLNLAQSALAQAQAVIAAEFGKNYGLGSPRFYANKSKGAQEAHEAIRPTDLAQLPQNLKTQLDRGQNRLYDLIWKRTLASQMAQAVFDQTTVEIEATPPTPPLAKGGMGGVCQFRAAGQVTVFDGFIRAYTEGRDDNNTHDNAEGWLPELSVEEKLKLHQLLPLQHFTEPPARYTDATLIKTLEAAGVGRPSTYAPTLATIQERGYAEKIEKKYHPTEIGMLVNDLLVENFPEIVDINFTSHIEEEFDDIAEGKLAWVPVIREFYAPFKKHLSEKEASVEKQVEISTTPCPHCGLPMLIKFGRMGKFLACPEAGSKVTLPLPEEAAKIAELTEKTKGELCPLCGGPMAVKRGRFGYFLGCTDYPKCKGISKIWNKTGFKCPACLASADRKDKPGDIVEKKSRGRGKAFFACTRFPDCTFLINKKPAGQEELDELFAQWKASPPKTKSKKFKN